MFAVFFFFKQWTCKQQGKMWKAIEKNKEKSKLLRGKGGFLNSDGNQEDGEVMHTRYQKTF